MTPSGLGWRGRAVFEKKLPCFSFFGGDDKVRLLIFCGIPDKQRCFEIPNLCGGCRYYTNAAFVAVKVVRVLTCGLGLGLTKGLSRFRVLGWVLLRCQAPKIILDPVSAMSG